MVANGGGSGLNHNHPHHNRFTALFLGPPWWAGARTELLDFMVQGKINRGRHADHPAGRHYIFFKIILFHFRHGSMLKQNTKIL